ncbi:glycoside hydrolase family 3 N-terminal domain-containing protein [Corynebacterium bovis]|uniref:glycoside hydrolase family 3 N-terminal domain-containing protein n=1 Tax=Corynebacterium bovis TaxID=36808 RepID=UPI0021AB9624|nr:glycoside hydrolase family 3 N-terminal domain-containing protein [Corynebacterium bovis]
MPLRSPHHAHPAAPRTPRAPRTARTARDPRTPRAARAVSPSPSPAPSPRAVLAAAAVAAPLLLAGCSGTGTGSGDAPGFTSVTGADGAATTTATAAAGSASSPATGTDASGDPACVAHLDTRQRAARTLAVGVTGFDDAAAAVDQGVRHLFIGSGTDMSILNGRGDPSRSLAELERRAGEPLTVSVDEEGGEVQRLAEVAGELPSARRMAGTMTPEQVRALMADHGRAIRALGVTVDFAPDIDLDGGADATAGVIGSRAFSPDPATVTAYATAYAQGLLDAGVTPVVKHFPGHGHASGDSHTGSVSTPPLDSIGPDLEPFAALSRMPGVGVMVGHVQVPGLDAATGGGDRVPGADAATGGGDGVRGAETPSSVNPAAYRMLRDGWPGAAPFHGTVYTDDLTGMKAISGTMDGPASVVAALRAGADRPLTTESHDVTAMLDAVVAAVDDGTLRPGDLARGAGADCR